MRFDRKTRVLALICYMDAALAVGLGIANCGPSPGPVRAAEEATTCTDKMRFAIFRSSTCAEAQRNTDEILKSDPSCIATYGDGGFDVCARLRRDGGAPKEGGSHVTD